MTDRRRTSARRRPLRWVAVALLPALLVACRDRVKTYDGSRGGAPRVEVLSRDGSSRYSYIAARGSVTVRPVAGTSGPNLRTLFVPNRLPASEDQESCATWSRTDGSFVQMGAAVRMRRSGGGRIRALTVTQNVYGWRWIFNVHEWDTASNPPMHLVRQIDFGKALGVPPKLPIRLCARVIGTSISVKAWPARSLEPSWNDQTHVASATVGSSWRYEGLAGWFVGHLDRSDRAVFSDLSTWEYRVAYASSG